ncbi:YDG domain-containing protein [Flavobacterium sangjuense]|uniref:Ig-like domain-containing protein n=1 Tax=Flavobacterium sangjuense TaxID=2518177 RepID=A0A4P7PUD5_9FLAO|nr:YDG domain-containing protein [Flavobacterium sangjuense]QBZ97862.1 hypothetical protein GS03_01360 [Flavobacterium sangjuense]
MIKITQNFHQAKAKTAVHRLLGVFVLALSIFSVGNAFGQISMTSSPTSYSQNFDVLATNSPGSNVAWADNSTIAGWYCNQTSYRTYTTGDATPTNRFWSCGSSTSSTERSFGSMMTSTTVRDWGVKLTNNTGSTLNSITIGFDAERWYTAGTGSNFIIQYSTSVSTLGTAVTNTTGASTGWTTIATISSPATSLSYTLSSLSLTNGSTIFIRFFSVYMGSASNVSLWATDNFTASWASGSSITAPALGTQLTTTYGTASTAQTSAVVGSGLSVGITATAQTNFEVSSDNATFGPTASLPQAGATLYVRLKSDAPVTGSYNDVNAALLSSTGAASVYVKTKPTLNAVTAKALTITGLTGNNKPYDGNTTASFTVGTLAYTGLVNSESHAVNTTGTQTAAFTTASAADGKQITVSGYLPPTANYTVTPPSLTGNITKVPLTITAGNQSVTYGTAAATVTAAGTYTPTGFVNSENSSVITGTASYTTSYTDTTAAATPGVTITPVVTGLIATNYSFTPANGTITITKANSSISITGGSPTYAYDGNPQGPTTSSVTGSTGTVSYLYTNTSGPAYNSSAPPSNAGAYQVVATVDPDTNYNGASSTPYAFSIISATMPEITSPLTASATYGVAAATYTITGTFSPTSFDAIGLPAGLSVNTSTGEITGTATAAPGNYNVTISATNGTGTGDDILVYTILAKELTVNSAVANNKVYNRTDAATFSGTLSGFVNGDDEFDVSLNGTGTFAQVTVGTAIAVTSTATLGGAKANYYTLTQPTGLSADITQKGLTISGATVTPKTYTGTAGATITGGSLVGVISPDSVTLVNGGGTFADVNVANGISVASAFSLAVGGDSANYTVAQPTLTGNITTAPLTITGLTGVNKPYDGNTTATFTGTPEYSGLQNGETFSVTGTGTATFANATAGNGKTITINGYTAPSANYSVTTSTVTANITKVALTITANNQSVGYGTAASVVTAAGAYTATGFVNSETASVISGAASYTTNYTNTTAVGASGVTITPAVGTLSAANYSFGTFVDGTITVTVVTNTTDYFRSTGNGDWGDIATWEASVDGATNWHTSSLVPGASAAMATIQDGHTVTISADRTIGNTTINSGSTGGTLKTTTSAVVTVSSTKTLTVNGTFENNGTVTNLVSTGATVLFNANSTYLLSGTSAFFPGGSTVTWNANSTINVTGGPISGNLATTASTVYGNITFNTDAPTGTIVPFSSNSGLQRIAGNLTVTKFGTGLLQLISSGGTNILPIDGNYLQSAGSVVMNPSSASSTTFRPIVVKGNFTLDGGTFRLSSSTANCYLIVKGNFTVNNSAIIENTGGTSASGAAYVHLAGNGAQTYSRSTTSTITATAGNQINFVVNGGNVLDMGTSIIDGSANVNVTVSGAYTSSALVGNTAVSATSTLITITSGSMTGILPGMAISGGSIPANTYVTAVYSGTQLQLSKAPTATATGVSFTIASASAATIKTANAGGLDSAFANGGTKTLNPAANYEFNGTVAQVKGSLLTNAANLTINNPAGVSFNTPVTVSGNLSITAGSTLSVANGLNIPVGSLTLGGAAQASGSTYGGTGSNAGTINATYFAATTGTVSVGPSISFTGTPLTAVNTTYGTASASTTFSVSGVSMTAGILVTPPSGYEVSLSSGSGYGATVTVGAAGTIASTPVYVRLAATTAVGAYSGNIVLSSTGALSRNVATVSSTVKPTTPVVTVVNNCDGTSTLSTTATGTLLWSTNETTASITVNAAATYTVTQTVNSVTSDAGSGTAAPRTAPTAAISNNNGLALNCTTPSTTLTASGGGTYSWSTGATTAAITVSPTAASTDYTVTVTAANGCTATATATVTADKTAPIAAISNDNGLALSCTTPSTTLTASGGGTYLWSTGDTTAAITVSPTAASTDYTVTVTSANGCTDSKTVTVTANKTAPPTPTISAGGPTTFCSGGSVVLTSSAASGNTWSTGAVSQSITVSTAGDYTVQVTNGFGCQSLSSAATTVTVIAQLVWYLDADNDGYSSSAASSVSACTQPVGGYKLAGQLANAGVGSIGTDCNDSVATIYPGAAETCYDGILQNCNGSLLSGCAIITSRLRLGDCGANLTSTGQIIRGDRFSQAIPSGVTVTGYRFRVTNTQTGAFRIVERPNYVFQLTYTDIATYSTTYTIEVALRLNQEWMPTYGAACSVTTPGVAQTALTDLACGSHLAQVSSTIRATSVVSASSYDFEVSLIEDDLVTATTVFNSPSPSFNLLQLSSFPIKFGAEYRIRVKAIVLIDSVALPSSYGTTCSVFTPEAPLASLRDCAGEGGLALTSYNTVIYANPLGIGGAQYIFTLYNEDGYSQQYYSYNRYVRLMDFHLLTPLTVGGDYKLQVDAFIYGFPYAGKDCDISVPAPPTPSGKIVVATVFQASAYPNPFANNFMLDVKTSSDSVVNLKVYDMVGRLIEQREARVSDLETTTIGDRYPSGVYNVVVSQEDNVQTLRVVKR